MTSLHFTWKSGAHRGLWCTVLHESTRPPVLLGVLIVLPKQTRLGLWGAGLGQQGDPPLALAVPQAV